MKSLFLALALMGSAAHAIAQTSPNLIDTVKTTAADTTKALPEEEGEESLEEIVVQSTRTNRSFSNTPTRLEVIDGEEVDEKNNMRPANVSMLLHESTGLQVQQTSATSANASIRVQGLDGRYTQLLKDGYANFGNFASGLSILEIPPLDLKQVELIKGPASTLYGGGAIAGVINFISKTPKEKAEYNAILNQSHIGQTNIGGYASQRGKLFGYSMLALANFQKAYDVDNDGFSELPRNQNYTVHPRLFFYPGENTIIMLGNSFTQSDNRGGDMQVIKGDSDASHVYFEENNTIRNISTLEAEHRFENRGSIKLKQSLSLFDRKIHIPNYVFSGFNTNSFTDASYVINGTEQVLIVGLNAVYDDFKQRDVAATQKLDARTLTLGAYAQHTWDATDWLKLETGLRIDRAEYENILFSKAEVFVLPRISALFKFSPKLSSRIGGGLGYKTPTAFTERTESLQYQGLQPLNGVKAERSIGGTADLNYRTELGEDFKLTVNQMFFYTRINTPLVLETNGVGQSYFFNAAKPVQSRGFETNVRLIFKEDFKFFAGYTFTNAKATYLTSNQFLPLLPQNKVNLALIYEKEHQFKIGLEGYFTDRQFLYNGTRTPSYWEFGLMGEKTFGPVSLFINFENFTDQRQSRYKRVVNPPLTSPTFDDIWNHVEGFVVNGGIKLKL